MEQPSIRAADGTETERAGAALVMAFGSDPTMRWLWPEADAYLRNFPRLVRAFGGRAFDHGSAHIDESFGGAALWLPPGTTPDGEAVVALFQETCQGPVREESMQILEQMDEHHTAEKHWYLPFIGVDASRQGEGLGAFLLRKALDTCDAEGLHAYLESSNPANVPFYQRHGFEVTSEIQAGSSPTLRGMLRPPS